jgi:hypothetical protein
MGKNLDFDPVVEFTNRDIVGISIAPTSKNTFAMAYATLGNIHLKTYYTNGTLITDEVTVDVARDINSNYKDLEVIALSENDLAICYRRTSTNDACSVYYINGTLETSYFNVSSIAYKEGMSISKLRQDEIVIGSYNGTSIFFSIYYKNGTQEVGPIEVDSTAGSSSYSVQVEAVNNSAIWITWIDYTDCDVSFAIYYKNGTIIKSITDIDTDIRYGARVDSQILSSNEIAILYRDNNGNNIQATIYYINGTKKESPFVIQNITSDNDYVIGIGKLSSTTFATIWATSDLISNASMAIHNSSGSVILSPTMIDNHEIYVTAISKTPYLSNINLCDESYIIAYANSTSQAVWQTYNSTGGEWDGNCEEAEPEPTSNCNCTILIGTECYINENCTFYNQIIDNSTITLVINGSYQYLLYNSTLTVKGRAWASGATFGRDQYSRVNLKP